MRLARPAATRVEASSGGFEFGRQVSPRLQCPNNLIGTGIQVFKR